MTLADADALVARLPALAGITADSRRVAPRMAFAAYPGAQRDGRAFIDDAIARGAAAVIYEPRDFTWVPQWALPHVAVPELRSSIGPIASAVHRHPSRALWMV
ncbi:MAG: Mur ligase domain-containing protein, partial [Rudaea sp.]